MIKYISGTLFLLLLLEGCAQTNIDYNSIRNAKTNTIKTYATLKPYKLENGKEFTIKLGEEHKEVIILKKQKVFAIKLLLLQKNSPFSLDILSSSSSGFFAPKILFLDAKNKIIRTTDAHKLQFDRGFFKGTIFINTEYKKIRSIIVTQDLKELHHTRKLNYVSSAPVVIPVGPYMMTYVTSSDDQEKIVKNAYGGHVNLTLKIYEPTILGKKK